MADLQRVQQAIQRVASSTGARDLSARANGDLVEIHGTVRSIAEKQSVMRAVTEAAGDVGIRNLIQVSSDAGQHAEKNPVLTHASETTTGSRTHKVAKGETLSHIAQHYYGKASEYRKIFDANRDKLSDPDKIREGMELKIPG